MTSARYGALLQASILISAGLLVAASSPASIDQLLSGGSAQPAFWGVFVEDIDSGESYYAHNASNAFLPASNQKILTSSTALDALGSDYRYRTVLYFDGSVEGSVLRGDLILKGSGDPTFGSIETAGGDPLRQWARRLAEMGVTRVEGRLIGDDDAFDDRPYAEGWDIDYITEQAGRGMGVSIGGLAYNDNVVNVRITAGRPGSAPEVRTGPLEVVRVRNQLTTADRSRGTAVETHRDFGSETITLRGSVPRSFDGTIVVPVTNPTTFTMQTLGRFFEQEGIEVEADVVDVDDLDDAEYSTDEPLFAYVSVPLAQILRILNKESNNFYAEQIFRSFAGGGSAHGGENRVKQLLSRAGVATTAIEIRDGSGLSRKNMMTPEAMARLLAYMYVHEEHEAFVASLAEGGERESTLRYRLQNVRVRAKTGSLEFVRALSGYVTTTDGRTLAFSIFANNYSGPSYQITQTIDRIVTELASATS